MDAEGVDPLLSAIRGSILFSSGFPKRMRFTHAEWASLGEDESRRSLDPGLIAIGLVKNAWELADFVRQLGDVKHPAAVKLLAELWTDCALQPVRNAAGHALHTLGTPEARLALIDLIEDHDHLSVYLAVAAGFDEDPAKAFDRFTPYFEPICLAQPGGAVVPHTILATFAPGSFTSGDNGEMVPHWRDSKSLALLGTDPRWINLCIALRRDQQLGNVARTVLRYAATDLVTPVLDEALTREGSRVVCPENKSSGDLLARYHCGERDAVWKELRSHAALGSDLLEEARAVAAETMKRVAHGAELLGARLAARGWQPLYGQLRTKPRAEDRDVMQRIEVVTAAPLPVSLRAFWEGVGGINFVWDYRSGEAPELGIDAPIIKMDPLCVDSPDEVSRLFEEWQEQRSGIDPEFADPFNLVLAPDYLHKANISGGGPYGIELPFFGVDPIFAEKVHGLPFVDYLRLCFRWAGFPRLERYADRQDVREFVTLMTEGIEPF